MDIGSRGPLLYSRLMLALGQKIGGDEALRVGLPASPFGPEEVLRLLAAGWTSRGGTTCSPARWRADRRWSTPPST